jgi:hypothetical protein
MKYLSKTLYRKVHFAVKLATFQVVLDPILKQQSSSAEWKAFLQSMCCSKNCIHLRRFWQYLHPAVRPSSLHRLLAGFPKRISQTLISQGCSTNDLASIPTSDEGMIDENRNGKKGTLRIYMQIIKHVDNNRSVLEVNESTVQDTYSLAEERRTSCVSIPNAW